MLALKYSMLSVNTACYAVTLLGGRNRTFLLFIYGKHYASYVYI